MAQHLRVEIIKSTNSPLLGTQIMAMTFIRQAFGCQAMRQTRRKKSNNRQLMGITVNQIQSRSNVCWFVFFLFAIEACANASTSIFFENGVFECKLYGPINLTN